MRFAVEIREVAAGLRAVVVDTADGRVVAVAESLRDAEMVAALCEREVA